RSLDLLRGHMMRTCGQGTRNLAATVEAQSRLGALVAVIVFPLASTRTCRGLQEKPDQGLLLLEVSPLIDVARGVLLLELAQRLLRSRRVESRMLFAKLEILPNLHACLPLVFGSAYLPFGGPAFFRCTAITGARSEERRVGKEVMTLWS